MCSKYMDLIGRLQHALCCHGVDRVQYDQYWDLKNHVKFLPSSDHPATWRMAVPAVPGTDFGRLQKVKEI